MTVDIAAIRAAAERHRDFMNAAKNIGVTPIPLGADPNDVLALCDLAERTQEREGIASTHWEDCWKAHDRCAAALYRKGHEV